MTGKQRWMKVMDGKQTDRLIFWPKIIGNSYMRGQREPFRQMKLLEMYDYIGCDIQLYLPPCFKMEYDGCSYEETVENGVMYRRFCTPLGELVGTLIYDADSDSYAPSQQIIREPEDIDILLYFFKHTKVVFDEEQYKEAKQIYDTLGERGICVSSVCESPLMDFLEWYAGIDNGQYMLFDYQEEVEMLFEQMQRLNCQCMELMCKYSPADILYITENTSTTMISPTQFKDYCHGHLLEYTNIANRYGRRLIFHMCGQIKLILPLLGDIPNTGIEALSSPPIGNTTFKEAREALADRVFIGGTCALTWLKGEDEIKRELNGYLDALPDYHGIVVGTGGIVPPACPPEILKKMTEYIYKLPMKGKNINAEDIVKTLTLEEKAALCSGGDCWHTKELPGKKVPKIRMCDGPNGLRFQTDEDDHMGVHASARMISYPTGGAMAASFDRELMYQVGQALGVESKAMGVQLVLGPAANIKRHPLCGRNFEYLSEDPYLTGELAAAQIDGIQDQNVGACMKHYACNNQETWRMKADVQVDERTLREIYLSGFEIAVKKSDPCALMASYNRINGKPATENTHILQEILRDEWGFKGFVVSDWGAVNDRVSAVDAGLDLEMPGCHGMTDRQLVAAVREGRLPERVLDKAACRIVGRSLKYSETVGDGSFPQEAHHELAVRAAQECAVLLKNEGALLPLKHGRSVVFIGGFAKNPRYQGGGSACVTPFCRTNVLEPAKAFPEIRYYPGFSELGDERNEAWELEAVQAARSADAAVIFAGLPKTWESESYDRGHMRLPECQSRIIEQACKVQAHVIVVLHTGSAVEMPWLSKVQAVLQMHTGGEGTGTAAWRLLYGEANPCGKLAETYPKRLKDAPAYLHYPGNGETVEYAEGVFVGYRYYDAREIEVNFPFGHGLSYTSFAYSHLRLFPKCFSEKEELKVQVDITNTGNYCGKEAVQLYVEDRTLCEGSEWEIDKKCCVYVAIEEGSDKRPVRELKGFEKVELKPGETKTVTFLLDRRSFAWFNTKHHRWECRGGAYRIYVGASSRDLRLSDDVVLETLDQGENIEVTMDTLMSELAARPKLWQQTLSYLSSVHPKLDEIIHGSTETALYLKEELKELPLYAVRGLYGVEQEHMDELIRRLNFKPKNMEGELWENYSSYLLTEYAQSFEEGKDIEKYRPLFEAANALPDGTEKEELAHVLWKIVGALPQRPGVLWDEPSDYGSIQKLCEGHLREPAPSEEILREKIKGAWYGRICGCLLGKPVECFLKEELHHLLQATNNMPMKNYIYQADITPQVEQQFDFDVKNRCYADTVDCAPADDDTNYLVLAGELIERCGKDFQTMDVARLWLDAQPREVYCTAERVAWLNAAHGIWPPKSAVYHNPYRELIGAQIRGDYFGYICPGNPKAAAGLGYKDAVFSHTKNGIYGEMFVAAMLAWAAVTDDMEQIVEAGLSQIPKTSRLYAQVLRVLAWRRSGRTFDEVIREIEQQWDETNPHQWGHTIPNAMIVTAVLLYGGGDYGRSICMAVQAAFDTDCNGATVGSVIGMAKGFKAISEKWLEPVRGKLKTNIFWRQSVKLDDMVERTMKHINM